MLLGVQATETEVTVAGAEAVIATDAEDDMVGVCKEVAVTVALPEAGAVAGAV